jgi:hypothetical protein
VKPDKNEVEQVLRGTAISSNVSAPQQTATSRPIFHCVGCEAVLAWVVCIKEAWDKFPSGLSSLTNDDVTEMLLPACNKYE